MPRKQIRLLNWRNPFAELEKPEHAVQKGTPSPASPVLSSEHAKKTDPFGELDKMEERVQKVDPSELEKSAPAPEHVKRSAKPKAEVAPEQINVSDLSAKLEKLKSQESHATQAEVKVAKITAHPVSKLEQSNASPETLHVATSEPSRIPKAEVAPKFERSQVLPASHAAKEVSEPQIERAKKEPESMEFQLEELKTALQETRLELKMVRQVLANSDAEKEKANATANASLAASASAASASASASASAASASGFFARLKASIFAAPARPRHTAGVAGGAAGAAPSSMAAFWGPAKAAPTAGALTAGGAAPLSASPVALVQRRMRGVDFTKSQSLEVPQVSISEPFRALEQQDQQEEQRLKDMYRHLRPQSGAAEAAESGQHFSAVWADLEEQDKNIQEALVDLDDPRRPLDLRQYQRLNAIQDASMSQLEGKVCLAQAPPDTGSLQRCQLQGRPVQLQAIAPQSAAQCEAFVALANVEPSGAELLLRSSTPFVEIVQGQSSIAENLALLTGAKHFTLAAGSPGVQDQVGLALLALNRAGAGIAQGGPLDGEVSKVVELEGCEEFYHPADGWLEGWRDVARSVQLAKRNESFMVQLPKGSVNKNSAALKASDMSEDEPAPSEPEPEQQDAPAKAKKDEAPSTLKVQAKSEASDAEGESEPAEADEPAEQAEAEPAEPAKAKKDKAPSTLKVQAKSEASDTEGESEPAEADEPAEQAEAEPAEPAKAKKDKAPSTLKVQAKSEASEAEGESEPAEADEPAQQAEAEPAEPAKAKKDKAPSTLKVQAKSEASDAEGESEPAEADEPAEQAEAEPAEPAKAKKDKAPMKVQAKSEARQTSEDEPSETLDEADDTAS
ncbi:unnamed protein product [Effrenium voratum]|uniref:Uncharacterized protein n=1 Tax=Effrenium voratum TaxID=2562239 RepID=A0AA36IEQ4_9DINO|nr:unnamed protein product [Effrenium voratum]